MKKRYVTLPVTDLVTDVAVDQKHVKQLAASLKAQGQLAPVQIRGKEIIDGFHRVAGLIEVGIETVDCIDVECTEEEFLDLRIASALTHEGVKADRAVPWIITEVEKAWPGQDAATLFWGNELLSHESKEWAILKSETWGVGCTAIAGWLNAHHRLAPDVWADKELDYGHRRQIGAATTDHDLQRKLAKKAKDEGLFYREIDVVAQAVVATEDEEERRHILETPLKKKGEEGRQEEIDELKRTAKVAKYLKTPPPKERKRTLEGELLFLAMDMETLPGKIRRVKAGTIEVLTDEQRHEFAAVVNLLDQELHRLRDLLGISIVAEIVDETGLVRRE